MHMACYLRIVGKNRMAPNLAIMGHMHISHDPVVVANPCNAGILACASVQSAELTDRIVIANFQPRRFPVVFLILGSLANRTELKKSVASPDTGMRPYDHMGTDARTGTDFSIRTDNCVRAYLDVSGKISPRINYCRWMYSCTHLRP
jgi:hypothetical protein